jgi:ankyrin repeat protein
LFFLADLNKQNNIGETVLIRAVINDKIEIVKLLLNAGIDIDKQNNSGYTALISAAFNNNREMIELLLDYAADEFILNDRDKSFYDYLDDDNKQYFLHKYPTSVYNAMSHWYKKSFTEFVKDHNIKNN